MEFSPMAKRLRPSPISDIFDRAVALRAEGKDLADFSVGEPDFPTPENIKNAGKKAIDADITRYTSVDGMAALKDAVARKFLRDQNLTFERSEIVVGNGAKPILAAAVAVVAGEGDEVIIPTPAWPSHLGMVDVAGAQAVLLPTDLSENYMLSPAKLAAAITPASKLLILSSPSNPTGAVYSAEELAELAEVIREHPQLAVISDDLYEHIVFDDTKFATLASVAPDLRDRILTVNGVSKAYAMTGWRIGYAAGPKDWARMIAGYFSQAEGSPCAISQMAAIEALDNDEGFLARSRQAYQDRRDLLLRYVSACEGLRCYKPEGSFYVFVDVQNLLGRKTPAGQVLEDDRDFANYLLDAGVVVTPGSAFASEGAMRISIATSEAEIEKGAQRILSAVEALI